MALTLRILFLSGLLWFCQNISVNAQTINQYSKYNFQIETRGHYGNFMQHHFEMENSEL